MDLLLRLCVSASGASKQSSLSSSSFPAPALAPAAASPVHRSASLTVPGIGGKDEDRALLADRVAALLCFYLDRYVASSADIAITPSAAAEANLRLVLSMLTLGAAQQPALRRWLWAGCGALPQARSLLETEDEEADAEDHVRGAFSFLGPVTKNLVLKQEEEGAASLLNGNACLLRWAFTAMHAQELRLFNRQPGPLRVRIEPAHTTAVRLAAPPVNAPSTDALAYALAQSLLLSSDTEGTTEERPVGLDEVPPLAAAYALLESPRRRELAFLPCLLGRKGDRLESKPEKGHEGEPLPGGGLTGGPYLAHLPDSHGLLFATTTTCCGRSRVAVPFALPAGFEAQLHEGFTRHLLGMPRLEAEAGDLSEAPRTDSRAWYAMLRAAALYEGVSGVAAAAAGYELQAAAVSLAAERMQEGKDESRMALGNIKEEDVAEDGDEEGMHRMRQQDNRWWRGPDTSTPLAVALREVESLLAGASAGEDEEETASQAYHCASLWSAVLATVGISSGAPGQYVRSVLEGGRASEVLPFGVDFPPLQSLLSGTTTVAATKAERDTSPSTIEASLASDVKEFGFPEELFLPTLEELEEYAMDPTGSQAGRSGPFPVPEPPTCREGNQDASPSLCTPPATVLHSAATLTAVALRHPLSMLFQHEHIFFAAALAGRPAEPGVPRTEQPPPKRRRRKDAGRAEEMSCRDGDGTAPLSPTEAEEELSRRLTHLFSIHTHSVTAGLPPFLTDVVPLCTAAGTRTGEAEATVTEKEDEATATPCGKAPCASLAKQEPEGFPEEGMEVRRTSKLEAEGEALRREVAPPPRAPTLRLKLSVSARHSDAAQPHAMVAAPRMDTSTKEPRCESGMDDDEDVLLERQAVATKRTGISAEEPPRTPRVHLTLSPTEFLHAFWLGEPVAFEDLGAASVLPQHHAAEASLFSPRLAHKAPGAGPNKASDHDTGTGSSRTTRCTAPPPLRTIFTDTVKSVVAALLQEASPATAATAAAAVVGGSAGARRVVLSLAVPPHIKALNRCLEAIVSVTEGLFLRRSGLRDGTSAVSADVAAREVLYAVLGECLAFSVYRSLTAIAAATLAHFSPARLTHLCGVLHSISRAKGLRVVKDSAHRVSPFFTFSLVSRRLLPEVLARLQRLEEEHHAEARLAALAAEAERRRRGVLSLTPAAATAGAGADAHGTASSVGELMELLRELGMIV